MNALIVDDLRTQCFILASLLSNLDCTVQIANSGEEALELAVKVKPEVVILDISMPMMDGYELATRLRNDGGLINAKIVAVSASDCDSQKLADAGIDRYIRKPVDLQALKFAIET